MAVDFNERWEKARTATDKAESVRTLAKILSFEDGQTFISNLEPPEAELCIEILDYGLGVYKVHAFEKQAFLGTLWELTVKHARLPNSMVITDEIDPPASIQIPKSGGFADIKQGQYKGYTVAVKKLRVWMGDDFHKVRMFCREVILWNSLSHPNVLKLVGVLGDIVECEFATVSEWMEHGTIMEYISKNATNRLRLLHGAAQGLEYLHNADLIHGDLKGANILMTNDIPPKACLADFGFMTTVLNPQNPTSLRLTLEGGTITFMAPELLVPSRFGLKDSAPTQEGDIYAFALVILQVLTGEQPFRDIEPKDLVYHVSSGIRPERPADAEAIGISYFLWELVQKCWDGDWTRRPQIQEVAAGISDVAADWSADMPPSGTGHWEDSVLEDESDDLECVGIYRSYQSGDPAATDSSISASQFGNAHTALTKPTEAGVHDELPEPMFKHPDQNNTSPLTSLPPRKHKGFKYLLKRVFGNRSRC